MTNGQNSLWQAMVYDLYACYYKYRNPEAHIMYYRKHLEALQTSMQSRAGSGQPQPAQISPGMTMIRVLHASPDAPAVDVYLNRRLVLSNVSFKQISDYMQIPGGQYRIDILPHGNQTTPVLTENVLLMPGITYTMAASGTVSNLKLLPIVDRPFVSGGETKVKFVHLSPDAPAVDVAVKNGEILFPDVSYTTSTKYRSVPAGKIDLEVRIAGTDTVALNVPKVQFKSDTAYTIFALGLANGNPPLEAMLVVG
ncbi:DUF4397 domain-containing protein [Bacillus sp. FJAT-42376]|uniref:DUF4397 domain-containing protein n=1 Tax=Bacillus sp. FJAT-42376 TaxID=2014076 RepID=UPI000F4EF062|nr:DUF4397 domain-containing protein [Bacillus sp. FJAT-42376]AZB43242.1 DUF4397 domain-containing protein [Bacillus sp. FJAT-42376]